MPESLRLFLALELPPPVRDSLKGVQDEMKAAGAVLRWVRPGSIHLTVKFLGQVEAGLKGRIAEAVRRPAGACPPLKLRLASSGVFPGFNRPRVVWIGLDGDLEPLRSLAAGVEEALVPLGFPAERRSFNPHLTLGRVKSPKGKEKLIEAVRSFHGFEGPAFEADELILFQSELNPSGAVYTALERLPLGTG